MALLEFCNFVKNCHHAVEIALVIAVNRHFFQILFHSAPEMRNLVFVQMTSKSFRVFVSGWVFCKAPFFKETLINIHIFFRFLCKLDFVPKIGKLSTTLQCLPPIFGRAFLITLFFSLIITKIYIWVDVSFVIKLALIPPIPPLLLFFLFFLQNFECFFIF